MSPADQKKNGKRCKMFQFNNSGNVRISTDMNLTPRFIRCGDNGIQLILWWIKMTAQGTKMGKMFGCWLLYHYRGYFCQLPWPGCAFPPLLASQLFIFPMDQFSLCTMPLAMHKSRQINFVKTENVNNLTQWMAVVSQLSSHYCVLSEDIYQRDQTIDQWHKGTRNADGMMP